MSKYRNIKVHVPTPEISEAVQKKLFEDGRFWAEGGADLKGATYPYLYVSYEGEMSYGKLKEIFFGAEHYAVHYQSILDPYYDVKIAWAGGEAVQWRSCRVDHWIDWTSKLSLDLGHNMDWRIKPKTKTIKQWERKYLQGDIVMTMVVSGPDDSNNMECWIGEAYEAEYEVPND